MRDIVLAVLAVCAVISIATAPLTIAQPSPFVLDGYVFYANGTACYAPAVKITNQNNEREWVAENSSSSCYYLLVLNNGTDLNTSEKLRITVHGGTQSRILWHTVNDTDVNAGGIYSNITLVEPPSTPFVVTGMVFYADGEPCTEPVVNITNMNTGDSWNAETHQGYNTYQLVISSSNVNVGDVLAINATDGTVFNVTAHTVIAEDLENGVFVQNITLTVPPSAPIVESVEISPDDHSETGIQVDPVPDGNKSVSITAAVSDDNGWSDVDTVVAVISGPTTVSDSPVTLSFVSNSSETTATYEGSFEMPFYYAAGNYTVNVTATDKSSLTGNRAENLTYECCIGLSIDAVTVNFGAINPGANSSVPGDTNYEEGSANNVTIKNTGNVETDIEIEASDMIGNAGTIANDNIYCGFTEDDYTVNLGDRTSYDLNLGVGEASYNLVNFRLHIPPGTAAGSYSGNITMTAVPS